MSENFPISHFFSNKNSKITKTYNNPSPQRIEVQAQESSETANHTSSNIVKKVTKHSTSSTLIGHQGTNESEELKSITEEILNLIKISIPLNKYKAFFEKTFTVSQLNDDSIIFSVSSNFIKKMIDNFYKETLKNAVSELLSSDYQVKIIVMNSQPHSSHPLDLAKQSLNKEVNEEEKDLKTNKSSAKSMSFKINSFTPTKQDLLHEIKSEERRTLQGNFGNKIDANKNFSNFIVGPSNNMAHAFAVAVAKNPCTVYPQLYIYGNSGLGKTHLLHAVCNYIKKNKPHLRICLTTATDFMSEMILAIQNNKTGVDRFAEFRRKYTDLVDVLIIDDIHELQGKSRTQSEFFYVFNELQAKKKQLIFTSDKAPKEIDKLEDRIRTRLNSALLVDIQQPDLETRIAILKKKAFERDIFLDDEVINLIASSVKTNVRELEGKLVKLGAYSDLMNVDIDVEIAKQQLNLSQQDQEQVTDIDLITNAVAQFYAMPLGDIKGKTRKKDVAFARHIAMYMCHKILKITLEEIGEYFANRDHSTVIHGIKKIEDLSKKDTSLLDIVHEIESRL